MVARLSRYNRLIVRAAQRVNYYKKYLYNTSKDYYPWLGYCLKTRKPSVGGYKTWNSTTRMAKNGICIIESPKFMIRVV